MSLDTLKLAKIIGHEQVKTSIFTNKTNVPLFTIVQSSPIPTPDDNLEQKVE